MERRRGKRNKGMTLPTELINLAPLQSILQAKSEHVTLLLKTFQRLLTTLWIKSKPGCILSASLRAWGYLSLRTALLPLVTVEQPVPLAVPPYKLTSRAVFSVKHSIWQITDAQQRFIFIELANVLGMHDEIQC